MTSTVAVTGSTGFVGRWMVRELLSRGYSVRALVHRRGNVRDTLGDVADKVTLVEGDICDARALGELVSPGGQPVSAVIHLVGIIRESRGEAGKAKPQTFERLHTQATRSVVEACERAGVKRYVHMSALGVGSEGRTAYQKSKWAAEQIVRRSSLDWTIFRPSLIHGFDGLFIRLMRELVSGEAPPWVFLPYFVRGKRDLSVPGGLTSWEPATIQPIAVQDVAKAFVTALTTPASVGEVYNLVGPEVLNWQELTEFFRDTLPGGNPRLGTWYIPGEHASLMAKAAGAMGLGGLLPFDAGQALMATEDNDAEMEKARAHLGLEPAPFRATVKAYASMV